MSGLFPFAYGDALVRVIEIGGDPWWVASDVAKVLGYKHTPT
jgi:prophage antirepressor-like protein